MSYYIEPNNDIIITRGDSANLTIEMLYDDNGQPYQVQPNDVIRFAVKQFVTDRTVLIQKDIPHDLVLILDPEDTANLDFGIYHYDIILVKEGGYSETFIEDRNFIITAKV